MRHGLHHGIFVREAGRDRGARTVLWIHGLGESGLCFEPVIDHPRLAGWRHVVPDLPGYGRTAWPREPLGLIDLADLLADLVADLRGDPVVAVGHSMGGVLATALIERHPSLVRGLVDVDGNVTRGDCTFSGQAAGQELEAFEARGFDALRDRVYEAGLEDRAQRGYYASLRLAQPASFHRHGVELVQWSEGRTLAQRRAALECPRIYVAGAPGGACEESRRLLDQARMPVAEIAPSGHWPFIDQPARFVTVLESFLGNQT
ncbi:alpha/beta fold hydrolase [bacterium]|nr:alpha/beta fold hydrolase [bacterium]